MKYDKNKKQRICSNCGYKVGDEEVLRCPRCFKVLLKKCLECNGCSLFK